MAMYGYVGLCIVVCANVLLFRAMYGCVSLFTAMQSYVGLCMAV